MSLPASMQFPLELALARVVAELPEPDALPGGCLYSPKWDGFRVAIAHDGDKVSLWSRQGKDLTRYFPELAASATEQLPDGLVLDGEAVIWNEGRLDFDAMQRRLSGGRSAPRAWRTYSRRRTWRSTCLRSRVETSVTSRSSTVRHCSRSWRPSGIRR